jgi:hypothetical protein
MSVKTMLPFIGVGSAFAILGLAASRRSSGSSERASKLPARNLQSGVHPRIDPGFLDRGAELEGVPVPLTSEFWDAAPESYAVDSQTFQDDPVRHGVSPESFDADRDGLTAEWLARATQAPAGEDPDGDDYDDPAEIAADSLSMISDASRHAAAFELDDSDDSTDEDRL